MSKKHHVKQHKWINGILNIVSHTFESLEDAMAFVDQKHQQHNHSYGKQHQSMFKQHMKVYDDAGQIVHASDSIPTADNYA
jgi:hypothetical protein